MQNPVSHLTAGHASCLLAFCHAWGTFGNCLQPTASPGYALAPEKIVRIPSGISIHIAVLRGGGDLALLSASPFMRPVKRDKLWGLLVFPFLRCQTGGGAAWSVSPSETSPRLSHTSARRGGDEPGHSPAGTGSVPLKVLWVPGLLLLSMLCVQTAAALRVPVGGSGAEVGRPALEAGDSVPRPSRSRAK